MGFQSIDKNLHRIVPPHFESGHDGHEKRLSLRPRIATTRENVRADQNSRTDSPLPSIVIRRHFFVIKECERFVSMATLCPFLLFFNRIPSMISWRNLRWNSDQSPPGLW